MSSKSNVTAAANRGAHRIIGEEAAEDVVPTVALRQADYKSNSKIKEDLETKDVNGVRPSGGFAAEVQSETDNPGEPKDMTQTKVTVGSIDPQVLKVAALEDANRIQTATRSIDLGKVGISDARIIMSEEHKSLGYRPPPDSLAARAQRSSTKHPNFSLGLDAATLRDAARADAERIKAERLINVNTLTAEDVRKLQSEEQRTLGYRPPPGSLSAEAQSVVDRRDREPVTKGLAAEIMSEEHKRLGHRPKSGSFAATIQSLADRNLQHGTKLAIADIPPL